MEKKIDKDNSEKKSLKKPCEETLYQSTIF